MGQTINTASPDGKTKGAITVETLSDGAIGLGFVRHGQPAQAIRLPRGLAKLLAEALALELKVDA